jgi:cytochrome b561
MIRNTSNGWGSISRWLHWILALTIIGMIGFGWWMNHIPARPDRFFYRSIHADIGYVILLLTVLRLVWRLVNPTPTLPPETSRWQKVAAHVSHGALYLAVIVVTMLGWRIPVRTHLIIRTSSACFTCRNSPLPIARRRAPMKIATSSLPMCCSP